MSKKSNESVIDKAKPHTIKKFELIENYVDEWARKILGYNGKTGMNGSKGVIYIDCMSNCGIYYNAETGDKVDGTALRVVKRLNGLIKNYPNKEAIAIFNDLRPDRIQLLKDEIAKINLEPNMTVSYSEEDCDAFLSHLDYNSFTKQHNTLLIYDPYVASINWNAIAPFLNRWGEVFINHMLSDTRRGASQAKKSEVVERYQTTYQKKNMAEVIEMSKSKEQLEKAVVSIINEHINNKSIDHYIASFSFYTQRNGLLYDLIHCCANINGFRLVKKVAWKTFGDKSSLKNTHGNEMQLQFDIDGNGITSSAIDDECYFVKDIARYIYEKYSGEQTTTLDTIYSNLDKHPIFPSDGYKNDIQRELKEIYKVKIHRDRTVVFPSTQGVKVNGN